MRRILASAFLALLLLASSALAYVIKLKDGSLIFARIKYSVKGEKAIITLENGTVTAIKLEEIDVEGSEKYNKENFGNVVAIDTPDTRKPTPRDEAPNSPRLQDYIREKKPRMGLPPPGGETGRRRIGTVVPAGRRQPAVGVCQDLRRRRDHPVQAGELFAARSGCS